MLWPSARWENNLQEWFNAGRTLLSAENRQLKQRASCHRDHLPLAIDVNRPIAYALMLTNP
jgi:hypothetical protein